MNLENLLSFVQAIMPALLLFAIVFIYSLWCINSGRSPRLATSVCAIIVHAAGAGACIWLLIQMPSYADEDEVWAVLMTAFVSAVAGSFWVGMIIDRRWQLNRHRQLANAC